jgi:hypothetical protein
MGVRDVPARAGGNDLRDLRACRLPLHGYSGELLEARYKGGGFLLRWHVGWERPGGVWLRGPAVDGWFWDRLWEAPGSRTVDTVPIASLRWIRSVSFADDSRTLPPPALRAGEPKP